MTYIIPIINTSLTVGLSFFSDSQQLFVGNLPHNCAEDELIDLFSKYGKVEIRNINQLMEVLNNLELQVLDVRINQKAGRADGAGRGGRDGKNAGFVSLFLIFPIL